MSFPVHYALCGQRPAGFIKGDRESRCSNSLACSGWTHAGAGAQGRAGQDTAQRLNAARQCAQLVKGRMLEAGCIHRWAARIMTWDMPVPTRPDGKHFQL